MVLVGAAAAALLMSQQQVLGRESDSAAMAGVDVAGPVLLSLVPVQALKNERK